MNIALRFINRSNDRGNSEVVLFQRNVVPDLDEFAVAWKVIRFCGRDCLHPFVYSTEVELALGDEHGNFSPRVRAGHTGRFAVDTHPGGRGRLVPAAAHDAVTGELEVVNALTRGAVNVNAFSAGRLIAAKHAVAPGQKAVFRFTPALWIGLASQVQESHALSAAVLSSTHTLLPLAGVARADIVMTGGGGDADAQPFAFTLDHIVRG